MQFVSGNKMLPGSTSLCHRYGGHQFGVWADQLGDGRAHMLGEYLNQAGERWELQLKVYFMTNCLDENGSEKYNLHELKYFAPAPYLFL